MLRGQNEFDCRCDACHKGFIYYAPVPEVPRSMLPKLCHDCSKLGSSTTQTEDQERTRRRREYAALVLPGIAVEMTKQSYNVSVGPGGVVQNHEHTPTEDMIARCTWAIADAMLKHEGEQ